MIGLGISIGSYSTPRFGHFGHRGLNVIGPQSQWKDFAVGCRAFSGRSRR